MNKRGTMKKILITSIATLICVTSLYAVKSAYHNLDPYNPKYVPGEILIKFDENTTITVEKTKGIIKVGIKRLNILLDVNHVTDMTKVFKQAEKRKEAKYITTPNGETRKVPQLFNIYKLKLSEKADIESIIKDFDKLDIVDYAEPNYLVYTMDTTPDDPYYTGGEQWYIDEVNAPAAWDSTTGDTSQVIGIIDTGVDWDHPDLDAKIWDNTGEIPDNSIDDDGNGFIDDVRGWDFVNNDNDPDDDNSHGTHVAGIAGAETDNGIGISGICWQAKLMPVKMLQSSGSGSSSDLASSIDYAANNGATVINMSLGSYGESYTVKIALENAYAYSVLVAAAGNDGLNLDAHYPPLFYTAFFPACYPFVLGVQASNQSAGLVGFSNFDPSGPIIYGNKDRGFYHNYELMAPGVGIYSTFPNGNYNNLSGTSMASPIVAGAVSLMKSYNPTQSTEQLFARLIQGADNGILDIFNSLDYELEPDLRYVEYTLVDTLPGCDNDGIADAGETVEIYLTVKNAGGFADSVWSKLRFAPYEDTTTANIIDSTSYIGDISAYATMTGKLDPFTVEIDTGVVNNRDIVFEYEIGAKNSSIYSNEISIRIQKGIELKGILLSDTTLHSNVNYFVTENFRISSGVTLTIQPGTRIDIYPDVLIDVKGSIFANANKDSVIIFNSLTERSGGFSFSGTNESTSFFSFCNFINLGSLIPYNPGARKTVNINKCLLRNIKIDFFTLNTYIDVNVFNSNLIVNSNSPNIELGAPNNPQITISNSNIRFTQSDTWTWLMHTSYDEVHSFENNNFFTKKETPIRYFSSQGNYIDFSNNYWGTTFQPEIEKFIYDFTYDASLPETIFTPFTSVPESNSPGVVWKVEINDVLINKYDNPYNSPSGLGVVGAETLKFDVHFNRAMDTTYTPFLTFGVREPYTQNIVSDSSSWSADSTVWTAYKTIGLETGDGINRVRVAEARDDEGFEIPIEDQRFEFVIQAAGSQSIEFVATAGIGKVNLEWPPAETSDALGYNLYRYENLTDSTFSDTSRINSALITDTTYTDFEVIPDTTYHYLYKIVGTDMQESDYSKVVTATPFSAANGDANGDLSVDVLDITSIVSYMLNQNPEPFLFDAADVNYDDTINVLDIIGVVNIILGDRPATTVSTKSATIRLKEDVLELESTGNIAGLQFELNGNNLTDTRLISQIDGFELATDIEGNVLTGVLYNLTGRTIPKGKQTLIDIETEHKIQIVDVIAGNSQGEDVKTTIDDGSSLTPDKFIMHQNYPNPFKHSTTIEYALAKPAKVTVSIYNIRGQLVKRYKKGEQAAGYYDIVWDSKNENGNKVGNGVYFYKLKADKASGGSFEKLRKVLIIK